MSARNVIRGVAAAAVFAYWGLALLGAVGNGAWDLVVVLSLPVVYLAVAGVTARRRAPTQPVTVPADHHEGG